MSSSPQIGGAERVMLDVLTGLRRERPGWELRGIVPGEGPLAFALRRAGVSVETLTWPRGVARIGDWQGGRTVRVLTQLATATPAVIRYGRRLRAAVSRLDPDVVISNGLKTHILSAAFLPSRRPLAWYMHEHVSDRGMTRRLLALLWRRCHAIIAVSETVARDLRACGAPTERIRVVMNGVDVERFTPEGAQLDLDRLAGLRTAHERPVRVGLVATGARWKGQEIFIDAMAAVDTDLPIHGFLIGGPIYETDNSQYSIDQLRSIVADRGLSERVGVTGYVPNTADAFRSLDIAVHASTRAEPFGLVIAEAMACAKPVIASNAGAGPEIITDGVDGVITPAGRSDALAAAIRRLAGDVGRRGQMGGAARNTVVQRFDRRRVAREVATLVDEIVGAA